MQSSCHFTTGDRPRPLRLNTEKEDLHGTMNLPRHIDADRQGPVTRNAFLPGSRPELPAHVYYFRHTIVFHEISATDYS